MDIDVQCVCVRACVRACAVRCIEVSHILDLSTQDVQHKSVDEGSHCWRASFSEVRYREMSNAIGNSTISRFSRKLVAASQSSL